MCQKGEKEQQCRHISKTFDTETPIEMGDLISRRPSLCRTSGYKSHNKIFLIFDLGFGTQMQSDSPDDDTLIRKTVECKNKINLLDLQAV